MRLLLIEDEVRLTEALEYFLEKENYTVDIANDGITGQDYAESGIYDVIILDWMLPGISGIELLREIRTQGISCPVIFLTAKDTLEDKIQGLDAGADDYLIKPFAKEELLARLRALGRRKEQLQTTTALTLGSLSLDMAQCLAIMCDKKGDTNTVKLSLQEAQLLEYFMHNQGISLSKEQILNKVWGFNTDVELSNVELYVFYLRKRIPFDQIGLNLRTIRGIGYRLEVK